jgi:hypothetical protein
MSSFVQLANVYLYPSSAFLVGLSGFDIFAILVQDSIFVFISKITSFQSIHITTYHCDNQFLFHCATYLIFHIFPAGIVIQVHSLKYAFVYCPSTYSFHQTNIYSSLLGFGIVIDSLTVYHVVANGIINSVVPSWSKYETV